jgi:endogenous inhibitor of DNA gyrase (YacG/DUF329 family)
MSDPSEKSGVIACAICGKPASPKFAPLCSRRCSDLDLSRWLKGTYVIPAPVAEEAESPNSGDHAPLSPEEE